MKIRDLPASSKPRERFLKYGPEVLSDAELMAVILRTGTIQENVVEMSNRLIAEYGLDKLFECSLKELQQIKGIGPSKAMQILAMFELGKRHAQAQKPIKKITYAEDVYNHFKDKLQDKKQEEFWVLLLSIRNHILSEHLITKGVLDAAIVHPREIFRPAIKNSASKIILVHNHPSGNSNPSEEDLDITRKLIDLGKEMEIRVLDSVIIGNGNWWSWVENKS
jgi:DNA repair protein RadC